MTSRDNDTHGLVAVRNDLFPIVKTDREKPGSSTLMDAWLRIEPPPRSFLVKVCKFLAVGVLGTLVNTFALFMLFARGHLPLVVAGIVAAELAVINNFFLNDRWTFRHTRFSLSRLSQFHLVSLGGMIINVLALGLLVGRSALPYWEVNLCGIALATIWNFAANSLWTWGGVA